MVGPGDSSKRWTAILLRATFAALWVLFIATLWYAAIIWLGLRAGGTLGGMGAPAEGPKAGWFKFAAVSVTLAALLILVSPLLLRRRHAHRHRLTSAE
ncbi:MAG: hypothetical protein LC808_23450 [Actinobacteria bacterium]|nr:hypothetical protein [Actinomycetota bacterium]